MLQKIDHLGIAVHSIAESLAYYEKTLGLQLEKVEIVESQQVKTAFLAIGETHIELLEPTGEGSAIANFLAKKGPGLHHIAYATDDLEGQVAAAVENGCQLLQEVPMIGAGGKRIVFLHPKSSGGVLTEFCAT